LSSQAVVAVAQVVAVVVRVDLELAPDYL